MNLVVQKHKMTIVLRLKLYNILLYTALNLDVFILELG